MGLESASKPHVRSAVVLQIGVIRYATRQGYPHIALRVASIPETVTALNENGILIAQGPVSFGESGQISVFVRDPDRNVIELRGREQGVVEGVTRYVP